MFSRRRFSPRPSKPTLTNCKTTVLFLSSHFETSIPTMVMGKDSARGFYRPRCNGYISIGRKAKPWVLAQEFAHHLNQSQRPRTLAIIASALSKSAS